MRKLIPICFLLFFCGTYSVFSQNIRVELPPGYNKILIVDEIPGKEGNPYLIDAWLPGNILLKNGKKIDGLEYRYNVYKKEMQYQLDNTAYAIGAPDSIEELWINKRLFAYLSYTNGAENGKDFFEIQVEGKAKLLIRYVTEIIPANYNKALAVGNKNDVITIKETYYLQKDNEPPFLIDKKGKNAIQALTDRAKEIQEFIRKENISFKSKKDVSLLVNYYNSTFK